MTDARPGFYPHSYYHVGLVVPDFQRAVNELERALGVTFNAPHESVYAGSRIRVAYASAGPPYYELIQGEPGGLWDTTGGARIDHVGYFSHDHDADIAALQHAGLPIAIDGRPHGVPFTYHRAPAAGMRIELVAEALREPLLRTIRGETWRP